ncbi:hypothetical protein AAE478_003423 [Parahypoxylon ruwenzoriense]
MKGTHGLKGALSRKPRQFSLSGNPHLIFPPATHPSPEKSIFAKTPLPTALFNDPDVLVLRGSPRDQSYGARFLLHKSPNLEPPTPSSTAYAAQAFSIKMWNFVQIITTPTADTHGTCLLLHFDNKRYMFGAISEGTQRAMIQRKVATSKVEDIFVTGLVNWHNAGGLLGIVLTLADSLASARENLEALGKQWKKKAKGTDDPLPRLRIHGGRNIAHLLATARRFVFRRGLPLHPHEIYDDPRSGVQGPKPDWQDSNINVWYMPVQSTPMSPRKRTHDEFTEAGKSPTPSSPKNEDDRRLVDTVVTQMFDSDWKMDALIETTLHEAKLPAKVFVRDHKGHIQVYTGPLPGSGQEVPNIPVLVRQPWPGAMIPSLPRTKPSNQSMCYIVKGHDRRGKFKPEVAEKHGIPKVDYKHLVNGQSIMGKDGVLVTPSMVLEETVLGNGFAVVDLPDESYVDSLVNRSEWSNADITNGIRVIFWILGRDLRNDSRLQEFMRKKSSIRHIVCSADACPNMISLESAAAQAYKLRCVDPDRFPLPVYSNEVSLSDTPIANTSSTYESGRTGKMIQFAPQFLHQDSKIVPFPDIEKLARYDLSNEILGMARKARAKVSDPEFLSKIEKVESDILHRDAEIVTLGTGSALPSKYRNVSATLVRVPGYGNYVFDCGENTIGQMRRVFGSELPEVLRDLKGIWISHLHADHHLGTASIIKAWHEETKESNPSAKLLVASHTHMIDWLREYADVEDYGFDRLVTAVFQSCDPKLPRTRICRPRIFTEAESQSLGLKRIDACYVSHCYGALATAFTFPSGLKISYSGDCRPSDDFVRIGQGSTLLIHESTFDDELRGDAIAKKHSTMSEAIDVGRRMGARRILLTHFSQRYQKIPVMEENLEIPVGAEGKAKAQLDEVMLVAFDYMRVKLGDFRKAQAFLPTIQKLFETVDEQ